MVDDIKSFKSHPDKFLVTQVNGEKGHTDGVIENVKKITDSKWAELIAIFHDLGKLNPNFQNKLYPDKKVTGYSNHAYFSAFSFFCAFVSVEENYLRLSKWLDMKLIFNDLIALTVLIAKHHGNLPDFTPEDKSGAGASILSKIDNQNLFKFLKCEMQLPIDKFANNYFDTNSFQEYLQSENWQKCYLNNFIFSAALNSSPLDFFLNTQSAFACLIQADKTDAAKFYGFIDNNTENIKLFCKTYSTELEKYISKLNQDSALNKIRTVIKNEAIENIKSGLKSQRVFELTSPTGSGKTLMLLSLAAEIINKKGDFRIIYALPYLSITEQVESEILHIFEAHQNYIQRIDSKAENARFAELQTTLDENPSEEKIREINLLDFEEGTFAYPLIITTFVRFFETLLSNQNAELLKLPNFSNCIFLLDEIQSLPPRLYTFFVAYLTAFCEKNNSYAIFSTATQPNFDLPVKPLLTDKQNRGNGKYVLFAKDFFINYQKPYPLLSLTYFDHHLFNRYKITVNKEPIDIQTLKEKVVTETQSILIIINTIDDTKELFTLLEDELKPEELILLNTHFTPNHRKIKIETAKERLKKGQKIILVSTQLIEAGVDIDFPNVFRDFATVSSIIQSAGRCNRNGKLPNLGNVYLFKLTNHGRIRSDLIYNGKDKEILILTNKAFTKTEYQEKSLINVQREFFNRIKDDLNFATHSQNNLKNDFNFLQDIQECQFDKIGKFQLIDERMFGENIRYFIPNDSNDDKFEILINYQNALRKLFAKKEDKNKMRLQKKIIEIHLKSMSGQIVQIRIHNKNSNPLLASTENYFDLFKLSMDSYSFEKGVALTGNNIF